MLKMEADPYYRLVMLCMYTVLRFSPPPTGEMDRLPFSIEAIFAKLGLHLVLVTTKPPEKGEGDLEPRGECTNAKQLAPMTKILSGSDAGQRPPKIDRFWTTFRKGGLFPKIPPLPSQTQVNHPLFPSRSQGSKLGPQKF